ncbi:uncharacterized protein SPSK_04035 [Sporothrix schenckii 1099-18]|uniref:Uncharacterized protein n=1 Tax=Sporothrix schenckii 1099-18 TaxID=1397361 RepID=A0A0F2M4K5_SPOSC|nr:uncharacterized protein SPSK_04035 [Sporothrix schenckii 1099-18]KJR83111.1 hypothetical protein SPSK_04035 [Sporothrix schenckii 1099-18]
MSDLGRRLSFGGSSANRNENTAPGINSPSDVSSSTQETRLERRSFATRRVAEPREHLHSFEGHPGERSALLPSLLSRPPTSPIYDGTDQPYIGDAKQATVQAKARAIVSSRQASLSPRSPIAAEAIGAHRASRPRALFRASSFLNLRSNSSFGSSTSGTCASQARKREDGDDQSWTPNPQSPRETAPSGKPWFEFGVLGRRVSSRAASNKSDGHEPDRDRVTEAGGQHNTSAAESSPKAPPRAAHAAKQHDWKQWDREADAKLSRLVNESDLTWHRPSFKQIIESLHLASMSNETVPTIPKMDWQSAQALSSKRRPDLPPLPSPKMVNLDHPIPGRYRSHITQAIEGFQDMQYTLDMTKTRLDEAREAQERDLDLFADLSKEWAAREEHFTAEIRRLRYSLAVAGVAEQARGADGRRDTSHGAEQSTLDVPAPDDSISASFHDRVKESIAVSSSRAKPLTLSPSPVEKIDVFGKGRSLPALIDNDHDKLISDEVLRAVAKERLNHCSRQSRRHRPGAGGMLAAQNDLPGFNQKAIDTITKKSHRNESGRRTADVRSHETSKKKKRMATKPNRTGDGAVPIERATSVSDQRQRVEAYTVAASNALPVSSGSSSSTSSSDEDLVMYEYNKARSSSHSANGEDEAQNGGNEGPAFLDQSEQAGSRGQAGHAEPPEHAAAGQGLQQHITNAQGIELTTQLVAGDSTSFTETIVATDNSAFDSGGKFVQQPVERASSF